MRVNMPSSQAYGKGANEQDMYGVVKPLSEEFIIIGIRGDIPMGEGFQYYELKSLGHPLREQFDWAIERLQAFVQYATDQYPVDPDKRYFLGFSQGAILSMSLALTLGNKLKGIVALNGYVPDFVKTEYALKSTEDVSVFISHGEYDSVFPVSIGHETAAYFQTRTLQCTFKTYPTDHGVSPDNQRDVLQWLREDAGISY
ncbi:esterase [Paenibacillus sp. Aloe-11]|nr:esterase [Paenibacillus sp. Aloe-11]